MSVLFGVLHKHEQKTFYPHETCKELKKKSVRAKIENTINFFGKSQESRIPIDNNYSILYRLICNCI